MKAIKKTKDAVMSVISKAKLKWKSLPIRGKVIVMVSMIFGALITLKIAGVLNIGWAWFYVLPLFAIVAMTVGALVIFLILSYCFFRNLLRDVL